jgi:hypothetical protein
MLPTGVGVFGEDHAQVKSWPTLTGFSMPAADLREFADETDQASSDFLGGPIA